MLYALPIAKTKKYILYNINLNKLVGYSLVTLLLDKDKEKKTTKKKQNIQYRV